MIGQTRPHDGLACCWRAGLTPELSRAVGVGLNELLGIACIRSAQLRNTQ